MPYVYIEPTPGEEPTLKYRFWITSNRGTDRSEIVNLPSDWTKAQIEEELEEWCKQFGAWHHSENNVNYGFELMEG